MEKITNSDKLSTEHTEQTQAGSCVPTSPRLPSARDESVTSIPSTDLTSSPPTPMETDSPTMQTLAVQSRKRDIDNLDSPPEDTPLSALPCLCAPEPKIPRPRNAFILYRQHHYASVVSKFPGINNPEISKKIGEAWRAESEEERERWKTYAEGEKIQHQQKYPSYRFQPRRNQKGGPTEGAGHGAETCPRCSRKPLSNQVMADAERSPDSVQVATPMDSRSKTAITLPPLRSAPALKSPMSLLPIHRLALHSPAYATHPERGGTWVETGPEWNGSDPKRRRLDEQTRANQPPSAGHHYDAHHPQVPSFVPVERTRHTSVSLPPAADLINRVSPHMGPLTTSQYNQQRLIMRRPALTKDLNLRVAPPQPMSADWHGLRTGNIQYPYSAAAANFPRLSQPPVMLSPMGVLNNKYLHLKKVLTPPPLQTVRRKQTFIVAVEGDTWRAVHGLSAWLATQLSATANVAVVNGLDLPETKQEDIDHLVDCMDYVKHWYSKSKEIVQYVTMPSNNAADSKDTSKEGGESRGDTTMATSPAPQAKATLVLLDGYVFTANNKFAAWTPPVHGHDQKHNWDWMACMWRGLIAPDLLIYVKNVEASDGADRNGVEMMDGGQLMVIRRNKQLEEGPSQVVEGVRDCALRRLGFEVSEWMRRGK